MNLLRKIFSAAWTPRKAFRPLKGEAPCALSANIAQTISERPPFHSLGDYARFISHIAHAGQMRRTGAPYTEHTDYVGDGLGFTEEERAVGYLHDVLEDTELSEESLIYLGIPKDVVADIVLVSTDTGDPKEFFEVIFNLLPSPRACKIKKRDIEHNSQSFDVFRERIRKNKEFQYGIVQSIMHAAEQDPTWHTRNIIDFVTSDKCPPQFKDRERIQNYTYEYVPADLSPTTSTPLHKLNGSGISPQNDPL